MTLYGFSPALLTRLAAAEGAADGFGLAIALLVVMILTLVYAVYRFVNGLPADSPPPPPWQDRLIPLLAALGLSVALYLTYIETTPEASAICGPVGNCNAVQKSPYAMLFGVLPVALLGAAGYVGMLAAWALAHWRQRPRAARWGYPLLFGASFFGTAFSAYLTYLEPFVIRAVCMWCITSAVLVTLILWFSLKPALLALEAEADEP